MISEKSEGSFVNALGWLLGSIFSSDKLDIVLRKSRPQTLENSHFLGQQNKTSVSLNNLSINTFSGYFFQLNLNYNELSRSFFSYFFRLFSFWFSLMISTLIWLHIWRHLYVILIFKMFCIYFPRFSCAFWTCGWRRGLFDIICITFCEFECSFCWAFQNWIMFRSLSSFSL